MGAGASKPSAEDVAKRYKKCAALWTAHAHCVRAAAAAGVGVDGVRDSDRDSSNSACAALETSLLACIAKEKDVAPEQTEAFTKCVNRAMSARGKGPTACAKEKEAMRAAVEKRGLWPPPRP
jgi:hypothetical protein